MFEYYFPVIDLASLRLNNDGTSLWVFVNLNWKSKAVWNKIILILGVMAIFWVAGCVYLYSVMRRPPERFASVMAEIPGPVPFLVFPFETLWLRARSGVLHPGDAAPDFTLAKLDKSGQVQLSSLTAQGRPVVLIFGSYT